MTSIQQTVVFFFKFLSMCCHISLYPNMYIMLVGTFYIIMVLKKKNTTEFMFHTFFKAAIISLHDFTLCMYVMQVGRILWHSDGR